MIVESKENNYCLLCPQTVPYGCLVKKRKGNRGSQIPYRLLSTGGTKPK
jgi:hypothetical protein